MGTSGNDLLGRAVGGDQDALAVLLKSHGPSARLSLVGRIPQRWQSVLSEDDVMQQTYADAVAAIGRFNSTHESSFAKWLETVARRNLNDAVKMLEAEKRGGDRRRIEGGSGEDSVLAVYDWVTSGGATPSRTVGRREAVDAMKHAIEQLPESYSRAVKMYYLEQQAVEDVAAALKRSPGAIFMLLARARDRLHEIMGTTTQFFSSSP